MTQINPQPIILKDVELTIGADTFERQISQVVITPNVSSQKWRGMSPGAVWGDVQWDWDITLGLAQDHETAGSLNEALRVAAGTKQTIQLKPKKSGDRGYQVIATGAPVSIGGQVGSWAESAVTMPVDGEPVVIGAGVPVMGLADPVSGPAAGGTMVAVTGSFGTATAVHFGTQLVPAADWKQVSPSLIVAKTPAQAVGSKPVKVTNAAGQSTTSAPFSYV